MSSLAQQLPPRNPSEALTLVPARPHLYFPAFDILRFALASGIYFAHSDLLFPQAGHLIVQCFFALSGFLIGLQLLGLRSWRDTTRFYFYRSVRIQIPYALSLCVFLGVALLFDRNLTARWYESFVYMATFTYNVFGTPQLAHYRDLLPLKASGNHYWSICLEEQFYLFSPLLVTFVPRVARQPLTWLLFATGAFFAELDAMPIFLGVLLATLYPKPFFQKHLARIRVASAGFVVGAVTAFFLGTVSYQVLCLASVTVIAALLSTGTGAVPGKWLGGASYSIYLNHYIGLLLCATLVKHAHLPESVALAIGYGTALALGLLHFRLVDSTIQRLRATWFTAKRGQVAFTLTLSLFLAGTAYGLFLGAAP